MEFKHHIEIYAYKNILDVAIIRRTTNINKDGLKVRQVQSFSIS